jgi:S1-C subfamily serine protease
MNPVDAIVLILLALGVVSGVRAGFFGPVGGLVGAALGFIVALVLASAFRDQLATIEQPLRAIATFAGLAAFVMVGEAAGSAAGASLSRGIRGVGLRPLDALGGGMVGAAHVVLLVWLVGGMLAAGLAPGVAAAARESVALRAVEVSLPPPAVVAGRLLTLLDTTGLPPLFAGLEPAPAPPVELPADADVRALAQSAIASTARISSTGCGAGVAVGSGFFISPTHVVTNAHVVAGSTDTTVTIGGGVHVAAVVAFDPDADLALLHVPTGSAPALLLSTEPPQRGVSGAAIGYPGGGELTVAPAAVTASYRIGGPNIYGDGIVDRSVVEMRTLIRPGNSGGPLVVAPGTVGGVVFGASRASPDVGYAIGPDQALASIGPFVGSTTPVGTGACL